jgi:glutamine synthetase
MLAVEQLEQEIGAGTIDTVVATFTDMQGHLMGKRIQGEFFLEEVAAQYVEGCNYLLALDSACSPTS